MSKNKFSISKREQDSKALWREPRPSVGSLYGEDLAAAMICDYLDGKY